MGLLKRLFIKILNFFGLTLLTKTNVVTSKTLNFKMPYPSIRAGYGKSELYIKPVISIDMIFDGYLYAFEFNVWYHNDRIITRVISVGHCKKAAYRHYKDFDIPQMLHEFLKENDAEKVIDHIESVADKYMIDTYAYHYSKLHEVYSKRETMPIGVTPIGTLDFSKGIADITDRMGKRNGEVKNSNTPTEDLINKFGGFLKKEMDEATRDEKDSDSFWKAFTNVNDKPTNSIVKVKQSGNGWYTNVETGEKYHGKNKLPNDYVIFDDKG